MYNFKQYRQLMNGIAANYFKTKKLDVNDKYPFILNDRTNWKLNAISNDIGEYIENIKKIAEVNKEPFPLHKYAHCSASVENGEYF